MQFVNRFIIQTIVTYQELNAETFSFTLYTFSNVVSIFNEIQAKLLNSVPSRICSAIKFVTISLLSAVINRY